MRGFGTVSSEFGSSGSLKSITLSCLGLSEAVFVAGLKELKPSAVLEVGLAGLRGFRCASQAAIGNSLICILPSVWLCCHRNRGCGVGERNDLIERAGESSSSPSHQSLHPT